MGNINEFKDQIKSDIHEYQSKYGQTMSKIKNDSWAFNFWILDKFFYVDESQIENYILESSDYGIDCYYYYDATNELYLLQNKYYEKSTLTGKYLNDDVFSRSFNLLESDTYRRSEKLQQIYNAHKNDSNFTVIIQVYVANNRKDSSVDSSLKKFNENHTNISAQVFYLDDIYTKYYDEEPEDHSLFEYTLNCVNKDTSLSINPSSLGISSKIATEYSILSIIDLYKMVDNAKSSNYNLVKNNIRDYMGNTVINRGISDTLNDDSELENFLYYNNGITIICDKMRKKKFGTGYHLTNPQIVNGCQTANTVYEILNHIGDQSIIKKKYSKCYVMVKILVIDTDNKKILYKKIVTFNNSQNSINKKMFEAVAPRYLRLKNEYLKKGFLLCNSPSDEYQFKEKYKNPTSLLKDSLYYIKLFGLEINKTKDFIIPLDKFLQVILAYTSGTYAAFQKKSDLLNLRDNSLYYNVLDFITKSSINTDLLLLYLLYLRSEQEKKKNEKYPISYLLLDCFSKFDCKGSVKMISDLLSSKDNINKIINTYIQLSEKYFEDFKEKNENSSGYNDLTKNKPDYELLKKWYDEINIANLQEHIESED